MSLNSAVTVVIRSTRKGVMFLFVCLHCCSLFLSVSFYDLEIGKPELSCFLPVFISDYANFAYFIPVQKESFQSFMPMHTFQ